MGDVSNVNRLVMEMSIIPFVATRSPTMNPTVFIPLNATNATTDSETSSDENNDNNRRSLSFASSTSTSYPSTTSTANVRMTLKLLGDYALSSVSMCGSKWDWVGYEPYHNFMLITLDGFGNYSTP